MSYPPPSPPYLGPPAHYSSGSNKPIKRIVLHGTVSPTVAGGARTTAAYFRTQGAGGSAHYVVDPSEVVQVTYDSVIAWHAPPNGNSIGIEFTDWVADPHTGKALPLSRWDGSEHKAMLAHGARLVAELCLAYLVPVQLVGPLGLRQGVRGICEHSDVSEAFKQSSHWDLGNFPRQQFLALVQAEVAAIKDGVAQPARPAPAPSPTKVVRARDLLEQAYRNARKPIRKRQIDAALKSLPER